MMKICFCLWGINLKPIGGCKIVYEYANRLSEIGHDVTIAFNCNQTIKRYKLPKFIRKMLSNYFVKEYPKWFSLNKDVKKICVDNIDNETIPDSDIVIATAITTAQDVYKLDKNKGQKLYFIQDFENWVVSDEEVINTYKLNMKNIVISKWLKEIVDQYSVFPSVYIPNGIDLDVFGIDIPIHERNHYSIAMLYHKSEHKGSKYGLEVIYRLKEIYPDLEARIFGVPERPKNLPDWINYTKNATQAQLRKIYNNSAIFLCTSVIEGFGLTGAESMACGCALVSTAYKGVFEYAEDGKNALISPIKDVDSLVDNIVKLFSDNDLRIKIATQGVKDINKLSWEESVEKFNKVLEETVISSV